MAIVKGAAKPVAAPPVANIETAQAKVNTTVVEKSGAVETSVTEANEPVGDVIVSAEPMANVGIGLSVTRNLGDYNSIKMSVDIHIPCAATEEGIQEAYEVGKAFVEDKLNGLIVENCGE
jgi:hypothetical protein